MMKLEILRDSTSEASLTAKVNAFLVDQPGFQLIDLKPEICTSKGEDGKETAKLEWVAYLFRQ